MTQAKSHRVAIYFREDGMSLSTNDLPTIESALRYLRHLMEITQAAPGDLNRQRVVVALEDFTATLEILWPGTSAPMKVCKAAATEAIFNSRSWTQIEGVDAEQAEAGAALLRACEVRLQVEKQKHPPEGREAVMAWIEETKIPS